jgi:nucleoside-diphosphate-sugar epimerase
MKICITGALGHIGSALIRKINVPVKKVYLVDNFLTQRYASLFNLPKGINYSFHGIDILSDDIEPIIKDSDVVIHLAAFTDAEKSLNYPQLVKKINQNGLKKIAETCSKHNCSLIFPSTTSVYGKQKKVVDENCSKEDLKPQSPYAKSKLYGENFLKSLSKKRDLKFINLRLGTIFGYSIGMRFHTAVNKFILQASLGQEITVWKTALNQKRPYLDLNDCISALNFVIKERIFDGETYNIVTANFTVKDIINVIQKIIPKLKIKLVSSSIMNQLSYSVSNQKSIDRGFKYRGNIEHSIRDTIKKLKNASEVIASL